MFILSFCIIVEKIKYDVLDYNAIKNVSPTFLNSDYIYGPFGQNPSTGPLQNSFFIIFDFLFRHISKC